MRWLWMSLLVGCVAEVESPPELFTAAERVAPQTVACPDLTLAGFVADDRAGVIVEVPDAVSDTWSGTVSPPFTVDLSAPTLVGVTYALGTDVASWVCTDSIVSAGGPTTLDVQRVWVASSGSLDVWLEPETLPLADPLYGSWGEAGARLRDVTFEEVGTGSTFFVDTFWLGRTTIQLSP